MKDDIDLRVDMCRRVREGSELGDAIDSLLNAVEILRGIGDEFEIELVLILTEKLCRDHITYLQAGYGHWEEYDEIPEDVFCHFTGAERKLTYKEFHGDVQAG